MGSGIDWTYGESHGHQAGSDQQKALIWQPNHIFMERGCVYRESGVARKCK